ncbi:MAG: hypothetical protein J1F38_03880 [Muribaculaceae bacterium]|nr:hypothetical protein [Muribaculaceae bacterium]
MNVLKKIFNKINNATNQVNYLYNVLYNINFNQKKISLQYSLLNDKSLGVSNELVDGKELIISLTSYGKRIEEVWTTIESLFQQTVKANKIVLWIDKNYNLKNLPASLKIQEKRGLIIKQCEDLRSYKKLIPSLSLFPNDLIITVDDDLLYDCNLIDSLVRSYLDNPMAIHAARTHVMTFNKSGNLNPYNNWNWCSASTKNNKHLFFTGGGGTLYPPHSLDPEVMNQDVFLDICPTADDVWFNAMALKNGTEVCKATTHSNLGEDFITNMDMQDIGLLNINVQGDNLNDIQILKVYNKYDLFKLLK